MAIDIATQATRGTQELVADRPLAPVPELLRHETRVHGTINGTPFELLGGGVGQPYEGRLSTRLETSGAPLHFPAALLDIVIVVGYPTYSNYQKGCFDLFKLSDGYEYERNFRFGDGGWMH